MMELICGACHGHLLVEQPGTTVACPHCGVHLQTPAAEAGPQVQRDVLAESGEGPASGFAAADRSNPSIKTSPMDS